MRQIICQVCLYSNTSINMLTTLQKQWIDFLSLSCRKLILMVRVRMSLILQAEKYYPGFHQMLSEIEKNEMAQLRQVVVKAQKDGEIRSSCNTDLLVQQIRLIFLGKSYQDALRNGLDVNSLREQLYFIYFLIKNK